MPGGVYLVSGPPGAGKTVLGNHIAHNVARNGGTVVFATILVETHDRMVSQLGEFKFFGSGDVAERVRYLSVYDTIMEEGLDGTLVFLRHTVRDTGAKLLVVDGAGRLEDFAESEIAFRRFTYELQIQLAALGCTCLLLSDQDIHYQHPIEMHVDGIFRLEEEHVGARDVRYFHVQKLRGRGFLRGRHAMEITDAGIEIYPRLEAIRTERPLSVTEGRDRKPFGIKGLDQMVRGGLIMGSTTMLLGAPGAGKTILGLHFLGEGLNKGEPALFVGFNESPDQLLAKAESVALGLREHYDAKQLRILWHPPLELLIDAWSHEVLRLAQEHRPTRIVIDGLSDVEKQEFFVGRLPTLLAALANEFGHMNITTVLTAENKGLVGSNLDVTLPAPSAVVENVILLRYVEVASQLHRLVSVLKLRESDHDTSIREFFISRTGVEVSHTFESAEAVLTGVGRQPSVRPREA